MQMDLLRGSQNQLNFNMEDNKMESQEEIKEYSSVKAELVPIFPDAERIELVTILNKEIVIRDFKAMPSSITEGHEYCVILADLNGKKVSFNSGEIVLKQLKDVKDKLPIKTKITRQKGKRYYTLT